MAEPIALISADKIEQAEFLAFIKTLGAIADPDKVYDGRVSKGKATVWISLNPEDLQNYPEATEERIAIEQKLGKAPQSYILLDITNGSAQLGAELACKFAERWSCVIDNLDGYNWKLFSPQEFWIAANV